MRHAATLALVACLAGTPAFAASSRPSWVETELYYFNHPLAVDQPAEVQTKMTKMAASAFAFYRGTDHIFFKDMKTLPGSAYLNTETRKVWLQGDLHMQNFGGFRDANDNDIFDISDFDESYFGPYTWDLRRLAVSVVLVGKELGFSGSDRDAVIDELVETYLDKMSDFKGTNDETSYRLKAGDLSNVAKDVVQKVGENTRADLLAKYTAVTGGARKFLTADPSLAVVPSATYSAIVAAMPAYINSISAAKRKSTAFYAVKDIRQRLGSGVGSLGRARYWILVEGAGSGTGDDVILEMKHMGPSSVAIANAGGMPASAYGNHEGARVVLSMKAGLTNTDVLAGYATVNGKPFYLKEKSPFQEDFDYTDIGSDLGHFKDTVRAMGKALAKTHALADQDYDSSLISYSQDKQVTDVVTSRSSFKSETRAFANDYATQVELDFAAFQAALAAGRPLY